MPLTEITTSQRALHSTVSAADGERGVWLFRVDGEEPYYVLAVERAAALRIDASCLRVSLLELVVAGCDLLLAAAVGRLLDEFANGMEPNPFRALTNGAQDSPIEGNEDSPIEGN